MLIASIIVSCLVAGLIAAGSLTGKIHSDILRNSAYCRLIGDHVEPARPLAAYRSEWSTLTDHNGRPLSVSPHRLPYLLRKAKGE
ncbi:MAG: hypothetical protein B7733_05765 [Myxococcales bacterium FL481]|nr:MAG: hypothetical protein B7733_05765 [Myxococcales bacterium FL481]